ncbi:hypothetical protein EJ110_NYTH54782 [Nymphaea thermarum]|nr:hypothetical protein EJ110_NYTH54782 [Nymphaea thermarum]
MDQFITSDMRQPTINNAFKKEERKQVYSVIVNASPRLASCEAQRLASFLRLLQHAALPSAACQAIVSDPDGAAEGTSHEQGQANSSTSHGRDSATQGTTEERAISAKGGYESTLGQRGRPPP